MTNQETVINGRGLQVAGQILIVVAIVTAVAAIIGGGWLASRTAQTNCVDICETTHPLVGLGVLVVGGGLLQALLIGTVGAIADAVAEIRAVQRMTAWQGRW